MRHRRHFEDMYARIVKRDRGRYWLCFWRNDLSLHDLQYIQRDDFIGYVLHNQCSYRGLEVWMKIEVEERAVNGMFRDWEGGLLQIKGAHDHMGIGIRIDTEQFPGLACGVGEGIRCSFVMNGTLEGLYYPPGNGLLIKPRRYTEVTYTGKNKLIELFL